MRENLLPDLGATGTSDAQVAAIPIRHPFPALVESVAPSFLRQYFANKEQLFSQFTR
jgi:hypothetical protein